jgi:hypothetical protein
MGAESVIAEAAAAMRGLMDVWAEEMEFRSALCCPEYERCEAWMERYGEGRDLDCEDADA